MNGKMEMMIRINNIKRKKKAKILMIVIMKKIMIMRMNKMMN